MSPEIAKLASAVESRGQVLAQALSKYGPLTLAHYAQTIRLAEGDPIQPRREVADAFFVSTERVLGVSTAQIVARQVLEVPSVLTGNHHGVDFKGGISQGTRVFGLAVDADSEIPVLACGNIPLNNITRPMSISLANGERINVFPNKYAHHLVSATPKFTEDMIAKALAATGASHRSGKLSDIEAQVIEAMLREDYSDPGVLRAKDYSDQSVLVNRSIWRDKVHSKDARREVPGLVYLEFEDVVKNLLVKDLPNQNSVLHQLMFDPKLRATALKNFSGIDGCWNNDAMKVLDSKADPELRKKALEDAGTVFFWGIDAKGGRYPLSIQERESSTYLVRMDKNDPSADFELTPENILARLSEGTQTGKKIIPSLFTAFSEISLVHGFKCYGGYRQIEYLSEMKEAMVASLWESGRVNWAEKVETIPTDSFITGLLVSGAKYPDGIIRRAGVVEIAAKGGFDSRDLAKMRAMTVYEAFLPSLPRRYKSSYEGHERDSELTAVSETDIFNYLQDKIVSINL